MTQIFDNVSILERSIAGPYGFGVLPCQQDRNLASSWTTTLKVIARLSRDDYEEFGQGLSLCAKQMESLIWSKQ